VSLTAAIHENLGLSFELPVDRSEVHKHAVEEVFLTDSAAVGASRFVCAARLPRSHPTYVPTGAQYQDLLLLLEVVRQATILVAHRYLDVPRNRQFLLRQVELAVTDLAACRRTVAVAPALVEVNVGDVRRLDGVVAGFEVRGRVRIDDVVAADGSGVCLCLPERDYQAVRGRANCASSAGLTLPAHQSRTGAAEVGREDDAEVMVGAITRSGSGSACAEIIVDPSHPTFFDHALDHVPGTLLVEACRQVAHAVTSAPGAAIAVGVRTRFFAFAELGRSAVCRAELTSLGGSCPSDPTKVAVEVGQDGAVIAAMNFDLQRVDV
jgi:A-factor biosynthesis hotdog domain